MIDRIAAIAASPLLANVTPEHRESVAAEIMHRAGSGAEGKVVADVAAEILQAEPWWITETPKPDRSPGAMNPWSKASFNVTEQIKLIKADPDRAARLQADAGA